VNILSHTLTRESQTSLLYQKLSSRSICIWDDSDLQITSATNSDPPAQKDRSGRVRVSIPDQHELFPDDGSQFPENLPVPAATSDRTKQTTANSERRPDPRARAMSTIVKTDQICNPGAATAISTPTRQTPPASLGDRVPRDQPRAPCS
jgi:hypothetical protein